MDSNKLIKLVATLIEVKERMDGLTESMREATVALREFYDSYERES